MHCFQIHVANESGASIALVAVALTALLAMLALSIDLGMLFTARSEAQRTADAAAHAGAIEFWKKPYDPSSVVPLARDSALLFARRNTVRNVPVSTTILSQQWYGDTLRTVFSEGVVDVIGSEQKVRVTLRRSGIPTWFARVFGVDSAAVSARSAAAVRYADRAECVKPFAIPDLWADYNSDGFVTNQTSNEHYQRYERNPTISPVETGFGSAFRNSIDPSIKNDWGRIVTLRAGNQNSSPVPSMYFSWDLPDDPTLFQAQCPGGTSGQSTYRKNICLCNKTDIVLGQTYYTNTGATVGDTKFGLDDLIKQDPNAKWDAVKGEVVGSDPKYGHWTRSPRVATIPLMDPRQLLSEGNFKSGKQPIVFNNFAKIFIESRPPGSGQQDDIYGRFLPFAFGSGTAPSSGPIAPGTLVRILQIVE